MTPTQHLLKQRKDEAIITESILDGDGQEIYYGEAYRGTATTESGWIIQKTTRNSVTSTSTRVSKFGVKWSEYLTVTYL